MEKLATEYKRLEECAKRTFWNAEQEKAYFDAPFQIEGSMPYTDVELQDRIRTIAAIDVVLNSGL